MSILIALVGNTGVGKTTLARALCAARPFATGLEQHTERPFQTLFKSDARYALANQVDYLLLRAEQERALRAQPLPALIDGGLEQDYYGFTQLFHARGLLSDAETALLERLYAALRASLPPPDLFVYLYADVATLRARLAARDRINIATPQDLTLLDSLLTRWLDTVEPGRLLRLDVSRAAPDYSNVVPELLQKINTLTSNDLI
ncbi:MAG: deoxynucleoside kinase [Anaerolineales bacterium]